MDKVDGLWWMGRGGWVVVDDGGRFVVISENCVK
jgi:hypothetical protein